MGEARLSLFGSSYTLARLVWKDWRRSSSLEPAASSSAKHPPLLVHLSFFLRPFRCGSVPLALCSAPLGKNVCVILCFFVVGGVVDLLVGRVLLSCVCCLESRLGFFRSKIFMPCLSDAVPCLSDAVSDAWWRQILAVLDLGKRRAPEA